MESQQRRSTLRSNRKPLSDCTNTLPTPTRRKFPDSQTLIKPPKPINSSANSSVNNKLPNPPPPPPLTCSSPKSHTSTGSNYSPNSVSIPSIPRSPEPPAPPTPLSDSGGKDAKKSRLSGDQSQRHDATTRKDKGKMVADAPIIQLSASITSNSLRISSSAAPDYCSRSGIQSVQSQNLLAETIEDKGKTVVDAPVIESPASWKSKYMHSTSSFTSDDSLSETSAARSQTLLVETRKDKGKKVIETPDVEASEPSTPHASVAASGTCERPVTVYNQRRAGRGRNHTIVKSNAPLTCPPDQRKKKKGLELDYDQDGVNSGSHTDPLPMHKKKRSRKVDDGLLKEEVETLRARYAEIDADKLLEEEVSEDDLE